MSNKMWHQLLKLVPFMNKNYFFSGWIANLGVVPLFFIAFFLFEPLAFDLLCLLVSVTFVRETIISPIDKIIKSGRILIQITNIVKIILVFCTMQNVIASQKIAKISDIIISKGEIQGLPVKNFKKLTIGNKEIISYKWLAHENQLLIKGLSIGFTNIKIWSNEGETSTNIYVTSKSEQLESVQKARELSNLNIESKIQGDQIILEGTIENEEQYFQLKKIVENSKNKKIFHLNLTFSSDLKRKIVEKIYSHFIQEGVRWYRCDAKTIELKCFYDSLTPLSSNLLEEIKNNYFIAITPTKTKEQRKNLRIKLKLIQVEKLDGKNFSFGLDRLNANIMDLFSNGIESLIEKNSIMLEQNKINVSMLAEPEAMIIEGQNSTFEIGSEIPFKAGSALAQNIQWKFAGIRVNIKLTPTDDAYQLDYETEFTTPKDGTISGNKNKATFFIGKDLSAEFFSIKFETISDETTQIPFIGEIPVMGNLFKSKSKSKNYKIITGYILLEEA